MKPKSGWQKGQLIFVKAPPYYEKEYPYEISGAGDKMIRANLQHSPKVKKSWSHEEFELLIEMGMVRVVGAVTNVTVEPTVNVEDAEKIELQKDTKDAKKKTTKNTTKVST